MSHKIFSTLIAVISNISMNRSVSVTPVADVRAASGAKNEINELINRDAYPLVITLDGWYKNGEVFLVMNDVGNGFGRINLVGRYNTLDYIDVPYDVSPEAIVAWLANQHYLEWTRYRACSKAGDVQPEWASILEEYNLIEYVTIGRPVSKA